MKNFEYHDIIKMVRNCNLNTRSVNWIDIYEDDDMRIERVDDKTVKCFLSNEELEEYDIDYKDFILRSDKAREIVQEIIEQAEEEVQYRGVESGRIRAAQTDAKKCVSGHARG